MTQVNFRIDDDTKRDAEHILDEMGMSMSTAITIFLKTVCRERRIPFEITADPFYHENNLHYLDGIMRDVQSGNAHFAEHTLIEVDDE